MGGTLPEVLDELDGVASLLVRVLPEQLRHARQRNVVLQASEIQTKLSRLGKTRKTILTTEISKQYFWICIFKSNLCIIKIFLLLFDPVSGSLTCSKCAAMRRYCSAASNSILTWRSSAATQSGW